MTASGSLCSGPIPVGPVENVAREVKELSRTVSEARAWIKGAAPAAQFAPTRFESAGAALDFVYKIYRAGALEVTVVEAGHALNIVLPADMELRTSVIDVCNVERERSGTAALSDEGQQHITLSWDGVPA